MKATILCLLMLALVAHADIANWTGKWYPHVISGGNAFCGPAGVLDINQAADGKATIKGKWDPYSNSCKDLEMAGEAIDLKDIVAQDNRLDMTFKSKTGKDMGITLFRVTNDKSTITVKTGTNSMTVDVELIKDDALAKFSDFEGKYTFSLTSGDAAKCCLPESVEVSKPDAGVFYTNGKWSDSQVCKDKQLGGVSWEKARATGVAPGFQWENRLTSGLDTYSAIATDPKDEKSGLQFQSLINGAEACKIAVTKTSSKAPGGGLKWWVWVLIVAGVLAVIAIGYMIYSKKKSAPRTGGHEYLKA